MEISKELLSNIIGKHTKDFVIEKNELRYILEDDKNSIPELYYINIYELAHKCKEWALKQGYVLESLTNRSCIIGSNYEYFSEVKIHKVTNSMIEYNIDEETESEAIFKACQWILDNKEG